MLSLSDDQRPIAEMVTEESVADGGATTLKCAHVEDRVAPRDDPWQLPCRTEDGEVRSVAPLVPTRGGSRMNEQGSPRATATAGVG